MYTFLGHLELAALSNLDCFGGLVTGTLGHVLNLLDDIVALKDLAEDNMAAVEPACDDGGNEELRAVGVLAAVGHAKKALARVLELEVLIGELGTIDGLSACSIASSEVTLHGQVSDVSHRRSR